MQLVYVLCGLVALVKLAETGPRVTVEQGILEGRSFHCAFGKRRYFAFQGIPYAEPPIGRLRFQPPEPPKRWTGVRNAKKERSQCVQLVRKPSSRACSQMLTSTLAFPGFFPRLSKEGGEGSVCTQACHKGCENCLFLNVYTNKVPKFPGKDKKPVMVWFHGGGFDVGSGNKDTYGPEFLLEQDVVVITVNYRLGSFGFLAMGSNNMAGNMGMKDQVMALKWVQQNILKFNGNSNKVTIFGGGTGGSSVAGHILSASSKKLFHGAISQSGSMLNIYDEPYNVESLSHRLAKNLGCPSSDNQLNCLQSKTTSELAKASLVVNKEWAESFTYYLSWGPTVEPPGAPRPFLQEKPITILRSGIVNDVPFLSGLNSNEGIIITPLMNIDREYFPERVDLQSTYIPRNLNPKTDEENILSQEVKNFYFGKKPVSKNTLEDYLKMVSDIAFNNENRQTLSYLNCAMKSNLYSYQFSFCGDWNYAKKHIGATKLKGASHTDELGYLFKMKRHQSRDIFHDYAESLLTSRRMVKMWTNFAKTGDPTSELDKDLQITWPPYTTDNPFCLNIDKKLTVLPQLNKDRSDFWDRIYRSYGGIDIHEVCQ